MSNFTAEILASWNEVFIQPHRLNTRDTLSNSVPMLNCTHRLYAQKKTAPDVEAALGDYVRRWLRWVQAALGEELTLPFCLYLTSPADTG